MNSIAKVLVVLLSVIVLTSAMIFAIHYFGIEFGGIIQPKGEISFGMSSHLGWVLTFAFFVLYLVVLLIRRVYYKLTGRI